MLLTTQMIALFYTFHSPPNLFGTGCAVASLFYACRCWMEMMEVGLSALKSHPSGTSASSLSASFNESGSLWPLFVELSGQLNRLSTGGSQSHHECMEEADPATAGGVSLSSCLMFMQLVYTMVIHKIMFILHICTWHVSVQLLKEPLMSWLQ